LSEEKMESKSEKKYMPELSEREVEELRKDISATSQRVVAKNIAKMKKADSNRPEAMQYFDEIADFVTREKEIRNAKQKGKKVIGYMCLHAPTELILAADAIPVRGEFGLV